MTIACPRQGSKQGISVSSRRESAENDKVFGPWISVFMIILADSLLIP